MSFPIVFPSSNVCRKIYFYQPPVIRRLGFMSFLHHFVRNQWKAIRLIQLHNKSIYVIIKYRFLFNCSDKLWKMSWAQSSYFACMYSTGGLKLHIGIKNTNFDHSDLIIHYNYYQYTKRYTDFSDLSALWYHFFSIISFSLQNRLRYRRFLFSGHSL